MWPIFPSGNLLSELGDISSSLDVENIRGKLDWKSLW
jgi:hypothetical protein